MRKDCTSQQFFRCNTNSKLVLWRISPAFPSSREIPSLPANSRGTEQQIPLTWTLRRQLRLLWVTDSWEQSYQLWRHTKFSAISTPMYSSPQKPANLKGIATMLLLTGEGEISLLKKNPSTERACFRQLLIIQPRVPTAPQKSTSCSNPLFLKQRSELLVQKAWASGLGDDLKRRLSPAVRVLTATSNHQFSGYTKRKAAGNALTYGVQRSLYTFHMHQRQCSSLPPP